jgi:hypothetical protein
MATVVQARELLTAWERGAALPTTDRAASLIALWDEECDIDHLTVGQCDALLFDLRRRLFGDQLDAVAHCPRCGEVVSLPLSLAELSPALTEPSEEVDIAEAGYRLRCRTARNHDLRALSGLGRSVAEIDVLERCLVAAQDPAGAPSTSAELPPSVVTAALDAMAEADPGAHVLIAITGPCGDSWTDQLDIRSILWTDLHAWVTQLLHDVHALATSYGWSERDILDLTPWRRDWYQEASGW